MKSLDEPIGEAFFQRDHAVKVGLVGLGSWSLIIADAVQRSKMVELVACFSRDSKKRIAAGQRYGCDPEESYQRMLKRNDIDAVILTTPNAVHAEQAVLAAQYGKHVFVDKPIANTLEDAKKIIEGCQKAEVILMVGHDMRRLSGFRKAKDLLNKGVIGKPIMVEANFSHNIGFRLIASDWRWYRDDSGCPAGPLMTMGVHHVDTLMYYFGRIKTVFSYFKKLYIPADVEDVTTTIFQFESGILGYLGSNYASPKANWISIYGTDANLLCNVSIPNMPYEEYLKTSHIWDKHTQLKLSRKGQVTPEDVPFSLGDPILEEIEEFASCIRTKKKPETDGQGALAALSFIRAAIESARTGKEVKLES